MSENAENTQPTESGPELTVSDLQNIRSIIDVAAKRGAFGAAEMSAVGGVFNKLDTFLSVVAPPQQPTSAPEGAEQAPATE